MTPELCGRSKILQRAEGLQIGMVRWDLPAGEEGGKFIEVAEKILYQITSDPRGPNFILGHARELRNAKCSEKVGAKLTCGPCSLLVCVSAVNLLYREGERSRFLPSRGINTSMYSEC